MKAVCYGFDDYFSAFSGDVYRLCLLLTRHPKAAKAHTFEAFLRLGAAKDPNIGRNDAKNLLFSAALRLCEDYYLRRMRRAPGRADLLAMDFPVTDALFAALRLPTAARRALGLTLAGFSADEIRQLAGKSAARAAESLSPIHMEAVRAVCLSEDDAQTLSDDVYARFAERSVGVENALHAIHFGFMRVAPYLALLVLALFALAVGVSIKMAG